MKIQGFHFKYVVFYKRRNHNNENIKRINERCLVTVLREGSFCPSGSGSLRETTLMCTEIRCTRDPCLDQYRY